MRQVCGLDVHKDSVFVCILNENGIVFQEKFGVLTQAHRREFSKPKYGAARYRPDDDYYVGLNNEHFDCVDRYFIDQGQVYYVEETFTLNKVESKRLHEFVEKHRQHGRSDSAREFVCVFFFPTGLGTNANAQCLVCGEVKDLTDYDAW